MHKESTIKLIDGKFNATDAAEILFSVLDAKIRFHNIQIMSVSERFNGSTLDHEKRLEELEKSKKLVAALIVQAKNDDCEIVINSTVSLMID